MEKTKARATRRRLVDVDRLYLLGDRFSLGEDGLFTNGVAVPAGEPCLALCSGKLTIRANVGKELSD